MHLGLVLAAALMLGACAQTDAPLPRVALDAWSQTRASLPDGGPPVDADGLHNNMGSCPGEGCSISTWQRVQVSTPLREQPAPTAQVIATLSEGEWVRAQNSVHRWRPHRGVVVDESEARWNLNGPGDFHAGDVVYTVDYEGEGFVTLWRRGETISWYDEGGDGVVGGIRWDPYDPAQREADEAHGAGFWIQVQRDNGQVGWVAAETVECLGSMDPTEACRARNEQ